MFLPFSFVRQPKMDTEYGPKVGRGPKFVHHRYTETVQQFKQLGSDATVCHNAA